MREIVFDTETTGLDPLQGDRLVEIGCIEMVNRFPSGRTFHCYFNPERDMPAEAFNVHGLAIEFLKEHRNVTEQQSTIADLKTTVAQQMQVQIANGMTGQQVARMILDHNGLSNVPVHPAQGGPLSDHYDPRKRTVNLSQDVYAGNTVASVAIALRSKPPRRRSASACWSRSSCRAANSRWP